MKATDTDSPHPGRDGEIRSTLANRLDVARSTLSSVGQAHLLVCYERLNKASQCQLLAQIESINWTEITALVESHVLFNKQVVKPQQIEPPPWYPHEPTLDLASKYVEALHTGKCLIQDGKVAVFTVAGGQGTRLGWDGPKGTFPATPIRGLPLFAVLAETIRKIQLKYQCVVPWYVMTSPNNDAQTRQTFEHHDYFGLARSNVMLFPQGMMPVMSRADGKVLLAAPDSLALSPNGHGGSFRALHHSGALIDMQRRGIEQISYTQVDNPLVRVIDPLFLGLHVLDDCQMSSKAVAKVSPEEKVGVFCIADGNVTVIEYSDMPGSLLEQRQKNGDLQFGAGSTAIHVIQIDFIVALNQSGDIGLPFHRAEKLVPYYDEKTGETVRSQFPNAVKLEMFVFDALPRCRRSMILQVDRNDEFAPIKNADALDAVASVDSPTTSRQIQIERAARWLEVHGVRVPRDTRGQVDALIEISPLTALEPDDLAGVDLPTSIKPGSRLLL